MTPRRTLELVGAGLLLVALTIVLYEWHREIVRGAELNATIASQKAVQADNQKQLVALADSIKQLQVDNARQLADVTAKFQSAQSPQQVATLVGQLMGLQKPIQFITPPATAENPHPVAQAVIPTEDTPQIKAYVKSCEECSVKLDTSVKQLTYEQEQEELIKKQLASVTTERDSAIRAVHGGSLLERIKHDAKLIAITGAIGAGAGYMLHR